MTERRRIEVGALARVEGEGALHLTVEDGRVTDLRLEIYEPPRFFEAFARGRRADELPDLMARICGICPVAYQMSAVHAIEAAWGVTPAPAVRALRRLYYAGEWLESHLLHMMFLAAPDLLGLDDAIAIARIHRGEVERALRLRKLGNRILILLGGRSVNPVGVRIGGFHRMPAAGELRELGEALRPARGEAEALLRWFSALPARSRPQEIELVALRHPGEYPMNEGRVVSSRGIDAAPADFDRVFEELQVPHSTALHARVRATGTPYLVGPLARLCLNADHLLPAAAAAFEGLAARFARPDPAASVLARGIEVIQAIDEALAVIDAGPAPGEEAAAACAPRAGVGHAVTEAPRGILYVGLETDAQGDVRRLRIVPPTAQNQAQIEADLRALAPRLLATGEDEGRRLAEAAIRDYDPCISCATHFLTVTIDRREPCAST
ncbi:MAG: nickel-dependent hydrogenase large subunit [Deltaproteobacteria bacterium]|nr:nickel-dependent hydrogenase large subunit [Deltaproteobacteria bacterium]